MKQPKVAIAVFSVALTLVLTGPAQGQSGGTFRASPEPANSARGVATPPKQPTVFFIPSNGLNQSVFPRQPVAFITIPAILMSDGSVLADFGMGYEQVTRFCGSPVVVSSVVSTVVSSDVRVIGSNGVVLSGGGPTYTQPVPNQQTASQQNLPSAQSRYPILTAASQTSCFSRDNAGRVFVIRQ